MLPKHLGSHTIETALSNYHIFEKKVTILNVSVTVSWAGNLHSVWCISPRAVPGIQTSRWSSDTSPGTNVTRNGECVKKVFLHLNPRCCKVGNLKLDVDGRFALCEVSIHARQEKLSLDDVNFRKLLECFDISDLRMILARGQDYAMDFLVHWPS